MKSQYEADEIHIVTEWVDGEPVETRLPKEKAETLYRKAKADIQKEPINDGLFAEPWMKRC